jgi:hypothetical protein
MVRGVFCASWAASREHVKILGELVALGPIQEQLDAVRLKLGLHRKATRWFAMWRMRAKKAAWCWQ